MTITFNKARAVRICTLVIGAIAIILSIVSTTSCHFFSVANRKVSLTYGIWLEYNNGSCQPFQNTQQISRKHVYSQAMSIMSPILGTFGMGLLLFGKNSSIGVLILAAILWLAAAACQLFTLLVLDSALCNNNPQLNTLLARTCTKQWGATVSIISCTLFAMAYISVMLAMKLSCGPLKEGDEEPSSNERDALMDNEQEMQSFPSGSDDGSMQIPAAIVVVAPPESARFDDLGRIT